MWKECVPRRYLHAGLEADDVADAEARVAGTDTRTAKSAGQVYAVGVVEAQLRRQRHESAVGES